MGQNKTLVITDCNETSVLERFPLTHTKLTDFFLSCLKLFLTLTVVSNNLQLNV